MVAYDGARLRNIKTAYIPIDMPFFSASLYQSHLNISSIPQQAQDLSLGRSSAAVIGPVQDAWLRGQQRWRRGKDAGTSNVASHEPLTLPQENANIVDIDDIQAHGIGAADIAKIKLAGYHTVMVKIPTSAATTTNVQLLTLNHHSRSQPQQRGLSARSGASPTSKSTRSKRP